MAATLTLIALSLTAGTAAASQDLSTAAEATPLTKRWAEEGHWEILQVQARNGVIVVTALGVPPTPASAELRAALDRSGLGGHELEIHMVGGCTRVRPAGATTCAPSTGGRE